MPRRILNDLPPPSLDQLAGMMTERNLSTLGDKILQTVLDGSADPTMFMVTEKVAKRLLGEI